MVTQTLNGLWSANVLALWIGDAAARDVSVFAGSIVILLIIFACIGWIPARSVRTLLLIGMSWVLLAIFYGFTLGYWCFTARLGRSRRTLTCRTGDCCRSDYWSCCSRRYWRHASCGQLPRSSASHV